MLEEQFDSQEHHSIVFLNIEKFKLDQSMLLSLYSSSCLYEGSLSERSL